MSQNHRLRILVTVDAGRPANKDKLPHAYSAQIEFLEKADIKTRVFGVDDRTSPSGILRNIRELREEILQYKPDVIVSYYGTMVAAISRWAAKNTPLVVTFRGSDLLGSSNPGWGWRLRDALGRRLSLWAGSGAHEIIVNGAGLIRALPRRLQTKTSNIPNGVNTDIFAPMPKEKARQALGWNLDDRVVLFNAGTGSGKTVKNLPLAESAIRLLNTPARLEVISACAREEVALRMNACDCLLVTSLHEGSPDLVKEAMSCDLPIVSVPCGDVPGRLAGVSPSYICEYAAASLSAALQKVLDAHQRSNGRKQLFQQKLDIRSVTARVTEIYLRAAAQGLL